MPALTPSIGRVVAIAFGLLVLAGVGLAIADDAGIVDLMLIPRWLGQLPLAVRVIAYVVVGVPVGLGIALYVVLETAEMLGFEGRPFTWRGRRRDRS